MSLATNAFRLTAYYANIGSQHVGQSALKTLMALTNLLHFESEQWGCR